MIRFAAEADIVRLAEIHKAALPGDFLPRLGLAFLKNVFFPCALQSKDAFTLVSENQGEVEAFVVFALDSPALTRELKAARWPVALALLLAFFRDPTIAFQVLGLIRGGRTELKAAIEGFEALPELYLIATHPERQGCGLGGALVREGLRLLGEKGHGCCVVKTSSARARKFYQALEFQDVGKEIRGNRQLWLLRRTL